jgi:ribose transport system substrate-binding protein
VRKFISLAVMFALVGAIAGCGSSSSSTTISSTGSSSANTTASNTGSTTGSSSIVAVAKAKVAQFESGNAVFPGPTTAFTPGNKKAVIIACGFAAPVCPQVSNFALSALKQMGWTGAVEDGQLSPQTQSGLVNQAALAGDGGIILYGIDVNTIKASIDSAVSKHIPIMCMACYSGALRGHGVTDVTTDFQTQGTMMGYYLVAANNGKATAVDFIDHAFPQTTLRTAGVQQVLSQCSSCKLKVVQMSVSETADPGPPTWTAFLAQNPPGSYTDAVALYDGAGTPMAKTLKSQGRSDPVVNGYDADPDVVTALADKSLPYGITIGEPLVYEAWSAVDLMGRAAAGKPLWAATELPSVIISSSNASQYEGHYLQPQGDWQANFLKLWGK